MGGYERRSGLVWPILVIAAGVLLLLNNMGVLSLDLWELLVRGWPLILIAVGIDLLFGRRSVWGSILAAILIIGVVLLGLGLYTGLGAGAAPPSYTIERSLGSATSAALQIDAPVVDLSLLPGAGAGALVEGGIHSASSARIDEQYAVAQGVARLRIEEDFPTPYFLGRIPDWNLRLGAGAPLAIDVNSGVGRAVIDLRGLQLETLNVELGVGQVSVWLPEQGRMRAEIGLGVGQVLIRVPRTLGVRISADRGLVGLDLPGDFSDVPDGATSPGFAGATNRVEISVDQGVGLISIRYSD